MTSHLFMEFASGGNKPCSPPTSSQVSSEMTRGHTSANTVYKSRSHHHAVQKLEIPSMGNHHVLIGRLLVSLAVYHSLTIAMPTYSPSDHGLRAYAEVQTTEIQDQVRKAKSIRDVLQILYPRQDPEEILRELMVVEGKVSVDRFSTSRGRIGQSDEGVPSMSRKATLKDVNEIERQENENVQCGLPVNMTIDAYQELGIGKRLGRFLKPECVTIPRCSPNFGCCPEDHVCTEISDKNALVQKLFLIIEHPAIYIEVKNITSHTSCHCTPKQRPTATAPSAVCQPPSAGCPSPKIWDEIRCTCKCAKGCPEPYSQDPYSCECDCLHSIRQCGKVKRGRLDMAPDECKCVESNECERPTCKIGVFSSRQCSCPSFVAPPKMKRPALY